MSAQNQREETVVVHVTQFTATSIAKLAFSLYTI